MGINRSNFLKPAGAATHFPIVPRSVQGGPGRIAPSDQLTKGIIGVGGIGRSSYHFPSTPESRLVANCDVASDHHRRAAAHNGG